MPIKGSVVTLPNASIEADSIANNKEYMKIKYRFIESKTEETIEDQNCNKFYRLFVSECIRIEIVLSGNLSLWSFQILLSKHP